MGSRTGLTWDVLKEKEEHYFNPMQLCERSQKDLAGHAAVINCLFPVIPPTRKIFLGGSFHE
ncbi:MAG: hypothetical protein J7L96_05065 [Bacteroidales bacterium]|nr:hypothetical protein [Bacteroidales bacterium]